MSKNILFAFRGDPMCFVHVLLNSLDLHKKGMGGEIILEGEAVTLVSKMIKKGHFLNKLYTQVKDRNLIIGACKACSSKLEVRDIIRNSRSGLNLYPKTNS